MIVFFLSGEQLALVKVIDMTPAILAIANLANLAE
jgi:hypothetical protein